MSGYKAPEVPIQKPQPSYSAPAPTSSSYYSPPQQQQPQQQHQKQPQHFNQPPQQSSIYPPRQSQSAVGNTSPAPFMSSPIPSDRNSSSVFSKPVTIPQRQNMYDAPSTKPLSVPSRQVSNVSPTPFGSGTPPMKSSSFMGRQSNFSPMQNNNSVPLRKPLVQKHNGNGSPQMFNQTPSETSCYSSPRPLSMDMSHLQNYNTAARGWGQNPEYYRPVTFATPKTALPYTDF